MNLLLLRASYGMFSRVRPILLIGRMSAVSALSAVASDAADTAISGNLTVTGTADIDGSSLAVGTQGASAGLLLKYEDLAVDTLTFYLNRNPGSFLWAHTSAIAAMRLTANHELVLYKADGSTAGLTFAPATNTISLGATQLYRDATSGALRTSGSFTVDGAASFGSAVTASGVTSAAGLTLSAGGTDQNVTVTPSGSGYTLLNGKVGIGTPTPANRLVVEDNSFYQAVIKGTATNRTGGLQVVNNAGVGLSLQTAATASGLSTLAQGDSMISSNGNLQFRGNDSAATDRTPQVFLQGSTGNVGVGTVTPASRLSVVGSASIGANFATVAAPSSGLLVEGVVGIGDSTPSGGFVPDPNRRLMVGGGVSLHPNMLVSYDKNYWVHAHSVFDATTVSAETAFKHFGHYGIKLESRSGVMVLRGDTGYVGVGTVTPNAKLAVYTGASGTAPNTAADDLLIEGSGQTGMSILTPNNQYRNIFFGGPADSYSGRIYYGGSAVPSPGNRNAMLFYTNGNEKMRIQLDGKVGIGAGNPIAKLDVDGGAGIEGIAYFGASGTANAKGLYLSRPALGTNPVNIQGTQVNFGAAHISMQAEGGYVGIGTSIPQEQLHATGNLRLGGIVGEAATSPYIDLYNAGQNQWRLGTSNLDFFIGEVTAAKVTVKGTTGDVGIGIGNSTPAAKLHVAGTVRANAVALNGTSHVTGAVLLAPQGDLSMGTFTSGTVPTVP